MEDQRDDGYHADTRWVPGGGQTRSVRSFVVRRARMNQSHKSALRDHGAKYVREASRVCRDPLAAFPSSVGPSAGGRLILEIGFGMGHATARFAEAHPNDAILGIEVYPPGVGRLINDLEQNEIDNVRIVRADAVDVLSAWRTTCSIDAIHVFFPDPWPKKRHHKRRLVQASFLELARLRIRVGGYLYLVTDWEDYALHMRDIASGFEGFSIEDADADGFSRPREWRPGTAFERKGLAKGHTVRELFLRRC
ncbi:MAG: tRNA (guanosine(46)-N7)-methyltransferase TrmB [Spirochaetaceae bacterium]